MKINNIGYLLKEGIRGIFLHGFMSFAAVFVTVACLLIVGSFTAITHNLSLMVEELNSNSEILAYVDDTYTWDKAKQVESRVRLVDNVSDADLVTREEALDDFRQSFKDPSLLDNVAPDTLQYRVRILLLDNTKLSETRDRLMLIPGVVEVSSPDGLIEGFTNLQEVLQVVSLVLIAILLFVSLLIISNTVKMAMADRKNEISIMKMVGATNGFIRLPFVIEGLSLGMLGAAIAFGLEWVLYDALTLKIAEMDTLNLFSFVPFDELLIPMIAIFGAAGVFVGFVGSWTSIRKFMDV